MVAKEKTDNKTDKKAAKSAENQQEQSNVDDAHGENNEQQQEELSVEGNTIETLKQQLEALKKKSEQNYDLAVRAKAELDNVRKRTNQEVENAHKYALEKFIPELLPLLDGLDQGLNTMPADEQFNSIRDGLNLSVKMFVDMLTKFGVEILNPVNDVFDPAKHEAIAMQESADQVPGTVLAVIQKGYALNNRILRPARVVVVKK